LGDSVVFSEYCDASCLDYRLVGVSEGPVEFALFMHRERDALPTLDWMAGLGEYESVAEPAELLTGINVGVSSCGRLVCSCWEVGESQILESIGQGASSVQALGERLRCGTQCGSCIPELKQLLALQLGERAA
jgi:assimilatory nitrate reductase catalytic subunit